MIKKLAFTALLGIAAGVVQAQVIFTDDFESGNLNNWTRISASTQVASVTTAQANSGTQSAFFPQEWSSTPVATDRYARNVRVENVGAETYRVQFYMYDEHGTTAGGGRMYGEVRSYTGDVYNSGTLDQLYAVGKNNSATYPGDSFSSTKYQGRVTFGPTSNVGWAQMSGASNRAVGWRKFEMIITATTITFEVDDVVARTLPRGTAADLDCIIMGSGLSSVSTTSPGGVAHQGYFDDWLVEGIPNTIAPTGYTVTRGQQLSGTLASLASNDGNRLLIISDENEPEATVEVFATAPTATPTNVAVEIEHISVRDDQSIFLRLKDYTTGLFEDVGFDLSSLTDKVMTSTTSGTLSRFIDQTSLEIRAEITFIPSQDLDSGDGWSSGLDYVSFTVN